MSELTEGADKEFLGMKIVESEHIKPGHLGFVQNGTAYISSVAMDLINDGDESQTIKVLANLQVVELPKIQLFQIGEPSITKEAS